MSSIGIVGHEGAKFTQETEEKAREVVRSLLASGASRVVSGQCHLGGIDIWAVEEARKLGLQCTEYPPAVQRWEGGYKERNIRIAEDSDAVYCIVVKRLPDAYKGMRFKYCYHCHTDSHVKSGGCWTARYAGRLGKPFEIIEI